MAKKTANKEVTAQKNEAFIYDLKNPKSIMDFSGILKQFIEKQSLSCTIQKKMYVYVDGWKFAGLNFGLTAVIKSITKLSEHGDLLYVTHVKKKRWRNNQWKETVEVEYITDIPEQAQVDEKLPGVEFQRRIRHYKYQCECDIINIATGQVVGNGTAICSNLEMTKQGFDEYAVSSMVQTRAIAKAYRNLIGYVMTAAGFESTPADEMEEAKAQSNNAPKEEHNTAPIPEVKNASQEQTPEQKNASELPEEIKMEIERFTDAEQLIEWASKQDEKSHLTFRALVQKKRDALDPSYKTKTNKTKTPLKK